MLQRAVLSNALRDSSSPRGPTRTTPGEYKLFGVDANQWLMERLFCRDDRADDGERLAEINGWLTGNLSCSRVESASMVAPGTWLLACRTGALYCRYCAEFGGPWYDEATVTNSFNRRMGLWPRDETAAAEACRRLASDATCQKWRAESGPREAVCSEPTRLRDAQERWLAKQKTR